MIKCKLLLVCSLLLIVSGCGSSRKTTSPSAAIIVVDDGTSVAETTGSIDSTNALKVKTYTALQKKYAESLHVAPDEITNVRLYSFIDNWLYTPYLWGGTTKQGIDCSAFVQQLLEYVYQINLPRTSLEQFYTDWIELFISTQYLREGDLVFFKTLKNNNPVTHIGFYLKNQMFVNSSSEGVSIQSLNKQYWKSRFVAAGRIKSIKLVGYKK